MKRILDRPPALGLSVEPTLGMFVVAKLAHRHGLKVELIKGVLGLTARITIPRDHLEVIKDSEPRPWDADNTEKVAAEKTTSTPAKELSDAETRPSVLEKAQVQPAHDVVPQAAPVPGDVVDLTEPPYLDPSSNGPSDLPVRTPGRSFRESDDEVSSVSPGEGASRIKTALAAYDRGRRSAEAGDDAKVGEDDHHDEEQS
jgi:hypothetical protein